MKLAYWEAEDRFDVLYHYCPACEKLHIIPTKRGWVRTGPDDSPTYTPSFMQDGGDPERRCHYIITNGKINFCGDSWHKRTDSIDMPEIPPEWMTKLHGEDRVTTDAVFKR